MENKETDRLSVSDNHISHNITDHSEIAQFCNRNSWRDQIICGDAHAILQAMPAESVHLAITSPPYNVGLNYDSHNDKMPYEEICNGSSRSGWNFIEFSRLEDDSH